MEKLTEEYLPAGEAGTAAAEGLAELPNATLRTPLEAGGLLDTLYRLLFTAPMRNGVATGGQGSGSRDSGTPSQLQQLSVAQVMRMDALDAELHVGSSWDGLHGSSVRCLAASLHGLMELLAPALAPGLPLPLSVPGPSGAPGAPPAPALRGLLLLLSPAVQRVQVCLLRHFLALHGDDGEDAEEGDESCEWEWGWGAGATTEGAVEGPRDKGDGRRAGGTVGESPKGRQRQAAAKRAPGPKAQAGAGAGSREVAHGSGWPLLDAVWDSRSFSKPAQEHLMLLEAPMWSWASACRLAQFAAASANVSGSGGSGGGGSGDSGGGIAGLALPPLPVLLRRLKRVLLAVRRAVRRPELVGCLLGLTKRGVVCSCEVAYYGVWGAARQLGSPGSGEELAACLPRALELVGIAADVASWLVADRGKQARELEREQQREQQQEQQQQQQQEQGQGGAGEAGAGGDSGASSAAQMLSRVQGDGFIAKLLLSHVSTCAVALGRGWTSGAPSSVHSHGGLLGGYRCISRGVSPDGRVAALAPCMHLPTGRARPLAVAVAPRHMQQWRVCYVQQPMASPTCRLLLSVYFDFNRHILHCMCASPSTLQSRAGGVAALPPAAAHEARERLLRCGWLRTCTRALRLAARMRAEVARSGPGGGGAAAAAGWGAAATAPSGAGAAVS